MRRTSLSHLCNSPSRLTYIISRSLYYIHLRVISFEVLVYDYSIIYVYDYNWIVKNDIILHDTSIFIFTAYKKGTDEAHRCSITAIIANAIRRIRNFTREIIFFFFF